MRLTISEQQVMEIYWRTAEPLSQSELLTRAGEEKEWKDRSVYILLNGLLKKGVLKEDGFVRSGKSFARRFSPALSYEEYLVSQMFAGSITPDLTRVLSTLLDREDIPVSTLKAMDKVLRDKIKTQKESEKAVMAE